MQTPEDHAPEVVIQMFQGSRRVPEHSCAIVIIHPKCDKRSLFLLSLKGFLIQIYKEVLHWIGCLAIVVSFVSVMPMLINTICLSVRVVLLTDPQV